MKRGKSSTPSDPNAEAEQARYDNPIASREYILTLLQGEKMPATADYLARKLDIEDDPERLEALRRRLAAMQRDGQIIRNRKGGMVPVDADAIVAGRISAHPDGYGFLITDDGDKDIYLHGRQMRQVLHNDRVVVCITGTDHRGRREGRVIEVVERANRSVVGRIMEEKGVLFVAPSNKRIHQDLLVSPGKTLNAAAGDMVVAEILEQPTHRHPPVGRVVEVLGQHFEAGMEIDVALRSHEIPFDWPPEVEDQAAQYSTDVLEADKVGREDVRDLPLVTIDGIDARDFDDAVYCEKTDSGWRLLVAIADVAHYVQPDTALDSEAQSRGTSVYFPGRVVPMLPEVLSNGLCSLNPEVDRLCMLCALTLKEDASIKRVQFYNGLMRSHARLTYDEVAEILTSKNTALRKTYAPLVSHLEDLEKLYRLLLKARKKRGVIDFTSNETRIIFNDNKKIDQIVPITRNNAHKLIEECMILANIAAAGFLEKHKVPALYRVHHSPKQDRLEDLRSFLKLRDLSLGGGATPETSDYAELSKKIAGRPDQSLIETVMLRSMQQAIYQPRNDGHFGLALDQYAHFTSPIRRYPDLLVHRGIKHVLSGDKVDSYRYSEEHMSGLGEQTSMTERRADEASRDVVSWLKCEYMQDHVGDTFDGVISAVTSFGLFVELPDIHVEGLIHVTNLSHDYYRFEQAEQALIGERTGRLYRLGDQISVVVQAVNLEERKIDFGENEESTAGIVKGHKSKNRLGKAKKKKAVRKKQGQAGKAPAKNAEPKKKERWSKRKKDKAKKERIAAAKKKAKAKKQKNKSSQKASNKVSEVWATAATKTASSKKVAKKSTAKKVGKKTTKKVGKKAVEKSTANTTAGKIKRKSTGSKKTRQRSSAAAESTRRDRPVAHKKTSKATTKKKVASKRIVKKPVSKKPVAKKTATKKRVNTSGVTTGRSKKISSKKRATTKRTARKDSGSATTGKVSQARTAVSKKRVSTSGQTRKKTAKKVSGKTRTKSRSTRS
ncbi:MAG: ribonuclease R [Gammaproteobacteria bacterium]|nr:ribonuclease R [Gammaproteobacteria bacterium]